MYVKQQSNRPQLNKLDNKVLFGSQYLLITVLGTHNLKSDDNNVLNGYDELINHIKDNQSIIKWVQKNVLFKFHTNTIIIFLNAIIKNVVLKMITLCLDHIIYVWHRYNVYTYI